MLVPLSTCKGCLNSHVAAKQPLVTHHLSARGHAGVMRASTGQFCTWHWQLWLTCSSPSAIYPLILYFIFNVRWHVCVLLVILCSHDSDKKIRLWKRLSFKTVTCTVDDCRACASLILLDHFKIFFFFFFFTISVSVQGQCWFSPLWEISIWLIALSRSLKGMWCSFFFSMMLHGYQHPWGVNFHM